MAVALHGIGRQRGALSVPATITGYRRLLGWARGFGLVEKAGVEGAGSFGAGLARFLCAEGVEVFEVLRPKRRDQYRAGKSDPIDAKWRHARFWRAPQLECLKAPTARWR